jgi:hypothetical protein
MTAFVNASNVRAYLSVSQTAGVASTQWTDQIIGSNINAASSFLQKRTGRQFEAQTSTIKKFSTHGKAYLTIPDLRSTTAVTLNDAALIANSTYYLVPDRNSSGVYVGIEFPSYQQRWYPGLNTFDINYNHLWWRGNYDTLPNNLVIGPADWGHSPLPDELLQATVVLASWYTLRPDALLANARQTPEGNVFDLSGLPVEISEFISNWKIEADMAETVG